MATLHTGVTFLTNSSEFFCAKSKVLARSYANFKVKAWSSRSHCLLKFDESTDIKASVIDSSQ